jgi:purine nucleoside permease
MRFTSLFPAFAAAATLMMAGSPALADGAIAPKVMVITMFAGEAKPWLTERKLDTKIVVPGLSKEFPEVACDGTDLCMMTTAMGFRR